MSSVVVNLRLSPEDFEATKAKAEREERSASAVIRRALKLDLASDNGASALCTCAEPITEPGERHCAVCRRPINQEG